MLVSFPAYETDGERKQDRMKETQERFGCGVHKDAFIQKPQKGRRLKRKKTLIELQMYSKVN